MPMEFFVFFSGFQLTRWVIAAESPRSDFFSFLVFFRVKMAFVHLARCFRYLVFGSWRYYRNIQRRILLDPRFGVANVYVGFRMMDAFGHVNNSRYLEICEFGRWHTWVAVFRNLYGLRHETPSGAFSSLEKGDSAKGEHDVLKTKSGGPYSIVLSSCHIQYLRPLTCFQFARVETSVLGMTIGGKSFWMQHRIFDAKKRLAAEALFKVTFIRWKDKRSVTVREALTRSKLHDTLLHAALDNEQSDLALNKDLRDREATATPEDKEELDYMRVLRRFFIFGEKQILREEIPEVLKHNPHLCLYDEGELAERAGMHRRQPVSSATALRSDLATAAAESAKKK